MDMNIILPFAFFAILFMIFCPMIIFVIRLSRREKALENDLIHQGTLVIGQIVKHRVKVLNRGCNCYLTYKYMFEDKEYEYEQWVNVEGFNSVRDGEKVEILVLPQDPSTPRLTPLKRFQYLL